MSTSPTLLLTNAIVLTMDAALTQYEPGAVAVEGDHIAAVGPEADLRDQFPAAQIIDCGGKVLMPGLVNAHGHAAMTLLRGLADDLRLDVWLLGYMMPVEREFVSPEFVHLGTQLACAEMIRSGTTCFADMYYFEDSVARATAEAGLRGVLGQSVLKFPAPDAASFEESLEAGPCVPASLAGSSADRAFGRAACALHLHPGDPARLCGPGCRVRCALADPPG